MCELRTENEKHTISFAFGFICCCCDIEMQTNSIVVWRLGVRWGGRLKTGKVFKMSGISTSASCVNTVNII